MSGAAILSSPDVVVDFEPDSSTLAVAFASLAGRWGGIPTFEFMKSLSALQVKQAFVRDTRSLWYQCGIAGAGSTVDELAAGLSDLVQVAGVSRVVFLGASAGGYAAILFATLVPVQEALVFGPQTFLEPERRAAVGDTRWPNVTREVASCLDSRYADLRRVLERSQPDACPQVTLHYAADSALDALHAKHLADLPSVELVAHPSAAHGLPSHLKRIGQLQTIISSRVRGPDS